jgi:hypothetical protein
MEGVRIPRLSMKAKSQCLSEANLPNGAWPGMRPSASNGGVLLYGRRQPGGLLLLSFADLDSQSAMAFQHGVCRTKQRGDRIAMKAGWGHLSHCCVAFDVGSL